MVGFLARSFCFKNHTSVFPFFVTFSTCIYHVCFKRKSHFYRLRNKKVLFCSSKLLINLFCFCWLERQFGLTKWLPTFISATIFPDNMTTGGWSVLISGLYAATRWPCPYTRPFVVLILGGTGTTTLDIISTFGLEKCDFTTHFEPTEGWSAAGRWRWTSTNGLFVEPHKASYAPNKQTSLEKAKQARNNH